MSDFFEDMMGGLPENISVKQLSKNKIIHSPVLYRSTENADSSTLTFLVDYYLSSTKIEMLRKIIEGKEIRNYQILYPLTIEDPSQESIPVYKQFTNYKFDLSQYVPRWSKIISFGRSIFSICEANDLDCSKVVEEDSEAEEKKLEKNSIIQGFYDTILWKTSFFDPKTKCQIFPVDSWLDLISKRNGLFAENFEVWFFKKQMYLAKYYELKPFKIRKLNLVLVENPNEWLKEHTADKAKIAIDTETKGLDPFSNQGKIVCITLSYDGYTGYYFRFKDIDTSVLREYLNGRPLVLTNGKYDLKWLHLKADIPLDCMNMVADTMILQQLCNEMMRKGLKSGTWLWTPYGGYDSSLDSYIDSHPEINKDYSLIPEETIFPYATTDPCMTMLVYNSLWEYMQQLDIMFNTDNKYGYSMKYCFEEIMMPALNLFTDVELRGMDVDLKVLKETSDSLQQSIIQLSKEIMADLGKEGTSFNVNSNDDLGKALEEMGLPVVDRNIKGIANVAESQLKNWSRKGYAIADKILKYREMSKNFSTFIGMEKIENFGLFDESEEIDIFDVSEKKKKKKGATGLYKYLHEDGKVHGNFSLFSTRSLRSRSFAMNLQQIPSHGEKAKLARKAFRPPTLHHAFLSTDLSGVQLRIGAILSQDKNMYDVFQKYGGNMHLMTASSYIPYLCKGIDTFEQMQKIQDDKSHPLNATIKDLRFKAKAINFLCEFGGSASVLAEQSIIPDWSEESMDSFLEANGLMQRFKELYNNALRGEFYFIKADLPLDDKRTHTKAYVVAEDLVKKFFEKYEGLKRWEDHTQELAREQGYIVTMHGTLRRLPYLLFKPIDKNNTDVNMAIYKNLSNIALNTQAQNWETMWINRATVNAMREMKEKGLFAHYDENGELVGGYIMGCIHDAEEGVTDLRNDIYKEQVKIMHKWFCKPYPETEGIPIECETNIAPTYITGELWDMGTEISPETVDSYSPKRE